MHLSKILMIHDAAPLIQQNRHYQHAFCEILTCLSGRIVSYLALSEVGCENFEKRHRHKMMKLMKFLIIVYFHVSMAQ